MKTTFLLLLMSLSAFSQKVVQLSLGRIEGTQQGQVRIFKGIPFAAPPLGALRWKSPQPIQPWKGVRPCKEFAASPIQNTPQPFYCWSEEFIAQPTPLSEDCLYLNVWTSAKPKAKQPVFVWIYGGGLSSGSANCAIYDGEEMAKKGVVFVSINYRVGVLGFMAHPELTKESGYGASGNYGFLDQIAALRWIQQNIAALGGDPQNVTIAGQSAGSFSVNALVASPLARGLFHKAIAQSGGLLGSAMLSQSLPSAEKQGVAFMKVAKCQSIEALRQQPAEVLQQLSNKSEVGRFGVTAEDYLLPTQLREHFGQGKHNQVPILTGWVTGDGRFLGDTKMNVEAYQKNAREMYGSRAEKFLSLFPAKTPEEVKSQHQLQTLLGFAGLPAHLLARYAGGKAYVYEFGHVPPDKPNFPNYGAFHTSEVPFALHTLHTWQRPWQQRDRAMEALMSSYWVNFAKTGDPNGAGLPQWPHYDPATGHIMVLDSGASSKAGLFKQEFDFLEQ
jgi:para-nitrobenzyl esterase